jgi:hypothetical protein
MTDSPLTLMTTAQVAAMLNVKDQTVRAWRLRGTGPRYHRMGPFPNARVVYALRDVEVWLGSRAHRSTSEETAAQKAPTRRSS